MALLTQLSKFHLKPNFLQYVRNFSIGAEQQYQPFKNRTAIVTGSTDGIGFATARRLAREGAHVVVSSRKQENVDRALTTLHQEGLKNVSGLVCDAMSKKDRAALIKYAVDKGSGIDILVTNEADILHKPLLNSTEEEWDQILDVNAKSYFLLTQEAMPHLKKEGSGSVVYISSIFAYHPYGPAGLYNISKTALLQMTKVAAVQLGLSNIRVNCIAPGLVETERLTLALTEQDINNTLERFSLLKRLGKPEEIASVVSFLCSEDATYITGETLAVTGGAFCRL